jgi:hypothetical protein
MAYESATNPTTGEKLFLVDNKWVPPSETATNPKTGQRAFLVNNEWQVLDIPKAAPTAAPTAAPATEVAPIISPEEQAGLAPPTPELVAPTVAAQPKPPSELAMGSEFGKGTKSGVIGVKSMATGVDLLKDANLIGSAIKNLDVYKQIDEGKITSLADAEGLGLPKDQVRMYLAAKSPEAREQMKQNQQGIIDKRQGFVQESLALFKQYQADAEKVKGVTPNATDIGTAKDFGNWLAFNVGSGVVQLAPIMLAAVTTGTPGALALGTAMGVGETVGNRLEFIQNKVKDLPVEQQANEIEKYIRDTSDTTIGIGLASGALDMFGPVGSLLRARAGKEGIKYFTKKEGLKAGIKEAPKDIAKEGLTGAGQEAIQIGGKRTLGEQTGDVFSEENIKAVINAAAAEAAGGLGGTTINTALKVAQGQSEVYKERAVDNAYKNAMATVLADKELNSAPPEIKQQIEQEATKSILESTKENLGNVVDSIKERIAQFVTPKTPEADEFTTLVNRYRDSGLTYDEALNQAKQDFVEAGRGDQSTIGGTDQSGISVPGKPSETDTGAIDTTGGNLAAAGTTTTDVGGGKGTQLGALTPVQVKDQANSKALDLFKVPKTENPDGTFTYGTPTPAVRKQIDAYTLGAYDAAQGFDKDKYATTLKGKEKSAYESGYTFGQETVTPTKVVTPTVTAASTTPVARGKPRGRPKAALTEAEAAVKVAERRAQQAAGKQVIRTAEKLQKISQEQFDPTKFETVEELTEGEKEFNERRRQALEDAYALAVQGSTKENKAGTIGQAILEAATPQERQLAKERYEMRKKTARSELLEATDGNENTVYTGFKTAANALSWLTKNGNAFERTLARRLMPFVRTMRVVIVRSPADLPSDYLRSQFEGAAGMYSEGVIYLAEDGGLNNTVFLHEALHGATIDRINKYLDDVEAGRQPEESLAEAVEQLNAVMKSAGRMYTALQRLGMTDTRVDALARAKAFTDIKEFIAYGMSNPAMQEFLLQAPGQISGVQSTIIDKLFTPFVQAIRKMFNMGENYDSAMQDLIIVTDKLLSAKFAPPKVTRSEAALAKKQSKNIDTDLEKLRLAKSSTEVEKLQGNMIKNHGFEGFKDLLEARRDALGNDFIAKLIYNLPTSDIVRWKGDEIPALVSTDQMMQEVSAMRMRLMTAVAKKAEALAKFTSKNGSEALSDAMHLARLKKVSPAKYPNATEYAKNDPLVKKYEAIIADPNTDPAKLPAFKGQRTQRINQIEAVYTKWDALGKQKGGHDMYKMVQEYYQDMYNLTRRLLDDQINQLPIDAADKAKLLKSVRMMHERSVSNKEPETIILEDGTESVEATFASLPEDYFPFTRRGQYYLNVQGPKGREFYLFESGVNRNVFKAQRARELGIDKNDSKVFKEGDSISALRGEFQDSSSMLKEMFEAIDGADTSKLAPGNISNFTEDLKDQLYQVYLMTMPERSFRKQFLHAEKITGFSSDILRNLKDSGTKYSNQLAKLKYGSALRNEIQRARDSLEGMPSDERGRLEIFINEMAARAEDEINPPEDSPWVNKINQISYLMLLTSGATAAVQMLAVPNMVMPTLNDQYGYVKSAAKLAKYMALWKSVGVTDVDPNTGETTYTAPSFVSSKIARDNENLRRAYQYAIDKYNTFSLTNTSVLTGANKTPTAVGESVLRRTGQTTYRLITALLNGSERISREITFGMSFELEFEKTGNFEESVKKAVINTQELLGRYDAAQRPRSWRNAVGKTILQFKTYSAFMSSWFLRNGYAVINKGLLDAEGRSAAHKLSQVILMGAIFHGLVGSPLYGVITSLINLYDYLFGDEDEMRKRRLNNPLTVYDSDMRFRYEFLYDTFGHIEIPGLDGRDHSLNEILEKGPASVLTDMNIGSRTSYDGLWFREAKMGANTKEAVLNFLAANLGPSISVGSNALSAIDDFGDGKIQRGLEKIAPAFFKAPLVAARLSEEGAKSQAGDMILRKDELNNLNIAAQALGFQPTRLSRLQERNFKYAQEDRQADAARSKLLKELNEATTTGKSPEEVGRIFKRIDKHNLRYPHEDYEIDDDTIERSLESYEKRKDLVERGLYIPESKEDILMPSVRAVNPVK